jgi:hypothetical protein
MELKRGVIGAAIVAAGALGGLWLFHQIPVTYGALQQACLEAHDRSLVAVYLRLPEGMTGEEYKEMVRTSCGCIAREALRQLPPEDLAAFVRKPMTPDIHARITAIIPHLARMCAKRNQARESELCHHTTQSLVAAAGSEGDVRAMTGRCGRR